MANKKGTLRLKASRMECNHRKSVETDKTKKNVSHYLFPKRGVFFHLDIKSQHQGSLGYLILRVVSLLRQYTCQKVAAQELLQQGLEAKAGATRFPMSSYGKIIGDYSEE
jgi:hypothetical protein